LARSPPRSRRHPARVARSTHRTTTRSSIVSPRFCPPMKGHPDLHPHNDARSRSAERLQFGVDLRRSGSGWGWGAKDRNHHRAAVAVPHDLAIRPKHANLGLRRDLDINGSVTSDPRRRPMRRGGTISLTRPRLLASGERQQTT
jgi:hypothetical protein